MLPGPEERLTLCLEILSCSDLAIGDKTSSDPYVQVRMGKKYIHQTKHLLKTLNPVYGPRTHSNFCLECFGRELHSSGGLKFVVKDWDRLAADDDLGEVTVPFESLWSMKGTPVECDIKLKGEDSGKLRFNCRRATDDDITAWKNVGPNSFHKLKFFDNKKTDECIPQAQILQRENSDAAITIDERDPNDIVSFFIRIHTCRDILIGDETSSDPYVKVYWGAKVIHKTNYMKQTLNPIFTHDASPIFCLECKVKELKDVNGLKFSILDWDSFGSHDELGCVEIDPDTLLRSVGYPREYKITPPQARADEDAGYCTISCRTANEVDFDRYGKRTSQNAVAEGMFGNVFGGVSAAVENEDMTEISERSGSFTDPLALEPIPAWELLAMNMLAAYPNTFKATISSSSVSEANTLFETVMEKYPNTWWIEFHDLEMSKTADDIVLAKNVSQHRCIKKVRLMDLSVLSHVDQIPPLLEVLLAMPQLQELEIRMKFRAQLPHEFVTALAKSSLSTIKLWNVVFEPANLGQFFTELKGNKKIKICEIWRCDAGMGDKFGLLASECLKKNKSLERFVVSHVGVREEGIVELAKSLKSNTTLEDLTLISAQDAHKPNVANTLQKRMEKNKRMKSLFVTYDTLNDGDCDIMANALHKNYVVKKFRMANSPTKKSGCANGGCCIL